MSSQLSVALVALIVLYGFNFCSASNILVVCAVGSHSHSIWCNKLAEVLVNKGHQVTILDTDPPRKKLANLTTYTLEGGYDYAGDVDYKQISSGGTTFAVDFYLHCNKIICEAMIYSPTFKRFLSEHSHKEKPFDLVIFDVTAGDCFLGIVSALGNPKLVLVTAFGEAAGLYLMYSEGHSAHSPMFLSLQTHPMGLFEKLENLFYNVYYYYHRRSYMNDMDTVSKDVFGNSAPHIIDIGRSAAVALVNSHPILDDAKYYSPAIVQIPGFHIDEPKKLDAETQAFLDGATHGAIYFSLGTNIQSAGMSKETISTFLNVFKKLKQRVLWKFEDESLKNLPENIKISKWFSQNDILAHPNIKLFITHCGLLSTQEAIHHGVPMIAIPFWLDQHVLTKKLFDKGVVFPLSYSNLYEDSVQNAIEEVLTNTKYTTEIKRWSKIFRDRPVKPKELAAYWVEHVLKNDDHKYLQPVETTLCPLELALFDLKTMLGVLIGLLLSYLLNCRSTKEKRKLKKP
ncbi:UDP-glucosyltransferase 2 [Halyomorpha halys]|uniref:UDP-glucosyltransferase 2 n=1 Tax=Halyomorpha halys TaxID=286706 RepID=UPI0006D4DD48|nr:UDP-glucuronosyltransferase 2B7-like [Halyomorpha halys]